MLCVMVGVMGTIVAVAAQQPTGSTPTPDKVIEALKGKTPPAEPVTPSTGETDPSMAAVLARYDKMIAAGQAAPTPKATTGATPVAVKTVQTTVSPAPVGDTASPSAALLSMTSAVSTTADTLDAIRADLHALLGRLDALARKGGQ
jgi:cytoskeletal protein RodZ